MKNLSRHVLWFAILNCVLWVALATWLKPTMSLNAIEAYVWSQHFAWGYSKNPYFIGWLSHIGFLTKPSAWGYYLLQFLLTSVGLLGLWALCMRLFNDKRIGIVAVFALSLTIFLDYNVFWNNDNFFLVALWPLMFLSYIKSLHNPRYWLLTALFAGLALMSKYNTVVFLPFMFLYLLTPKQRKHFTSPWFYAGVVLFIIINLPNLYWSVSNHFQAFRWFHERSTDHMSWGGKIGNIIGNFYLLLLVPGILWVSGNRFIRHQQPAADIKTFRFIVVWPTIFTLIGLLVTGQSIYSEWLVPYGFFAVPMIFAYCTVDPNQQINTKTLLWIGWGIFVAKVLIFIVGYGIDTQRNDRSFLPAKQMAHAAEHFWQQHTHTPLRYVSGEPHMAGYVAFYSGKAIDYVPMSILPQHGGVIITKGLCPKTTLPMLQKRFAYLGKNNPYGQEICMRLVARR